MLEQTELFPDSTPEDTDGSPIVLGNLCIEVEEVRVFAGKRRLQLTLQEFDLLVLFGRAAGSPVSQEILARRLWGETTPQRKRHLSVLVARLRAKLGSSSTYRLVTLRQRGYGLMLGPTPPLPSASNKEPGTGNR
jgi:DNA-binding response OmpR family regulator